MGAGAGAGMRRRTAALGCCLWSLGRQNAEASCALDGLSLRDPYTSEPNPFGWPLTPGAWDFANPDCWPERYAACGGQRQSPMDLNLLLREDTCVSSLHGAAGALIGRAAYRPVTGRPDVSVSRYMRSAAVSGDFGTLTLQDAHGNDVRYEARQVHLMAGSLHSINGSSADAEMLVVHSAAVPTSAGALPFLVLCVRFRTGAGSSPIFSQLGFPDGRDARGYEPSSRWSASSIIYLDREVAGPLLGTSYSYAGSAPVPPCSEDVQYIVLDALLPVTTSQVAQLQEVLLARAGGFQKRPPVPRESDNRQCREIAVNSLVTFQPQAQCEAQASERMASCWAERCNLSPVDISSMQADRSQAPASPSTMLHYTVADRLTVTPSRYSLDVLGNFGSLMVNGRLFEARKLSIKALSQHTFDGLRYAGELVVDHSMFGDGLSGSPDTPHPRRMEEDQEPPPYVEQEHAGPHHVKVSVPLTLGRENELLRAMGLGVLANKAAIRDGNSYDVHGPVDLAAALLPLYSRGWYWYSGGPTTPGSCPAWGVKWMVFAQPLEVSLEQLNFLMLEISGFDSTMSTQPIAATAIARGYVPDDGVEQVGGCRHTGANLYRHPSCWKKVSLLCRNGQAQSPINIESSAVTEVGNESFLARISWKPVVGLRLAHSAYHLGFESTQLGYVTVIGPNGFPKYYQVTSVALRMPSEHLIDGRQFPAELQIVHKNQRTVLELEDDDVLITSVLFELGEESKLLKQFLLEHLPNQGGRLPIEKPVDLMWALGPALEGPFFKYDGSYTTPGCAEDVQWLVFERPMTLNLTQWQAFKAILPNPSNNRPVQPLNGRSILKSVLDEAPTASYEFFLNRETGRNRPQPPPGLIAFPVLGTLLLCAVVAVAIFQREDPQRKGSSCGGLEEDWATTLGRPSYNRL